MRFLIDTGAEVSILPASASHRSLPPALHLYAANGTKIPVFKRKTMLVELNLRRSFEWTFYVAAVSQALLGADFLDHFGLLVDVQNRRLVDPLTSLAARVHPTPVASQCLSVIRPGDKFAALLRTFPTLLQPYSTARPVKHHVMHHIETSGRPTHAKARRLAPDRYKLAKAEFESLMRAGVIRPSSSNWSSALHIVAKKNGDIRPCGDYRALNTLTKLDRYPVPNIQEFTSQLSGSTVFSRIDLVKAFHQIPVQPEDIPKTAIITPFGLFEYTRMPFGLKNAAQTFQRFIDEVVRGLPFCFAYIDDLLIASPDADSHHTHLSQLFTRLEDYGIQINVEKSVLGVPSLDFLGHTISSAGIAPLPSKCEAVQHFPKPTTQRQLKQFLGMVNYYNRFVPRCSLLLHPLYSMLKPCKRGQSVILDWTTEAEAAFTSAKDALSAASTLSFPSPDASISISTDASSLGVGAVLQQRIDDDWRPVAFFSRKFSTAEAKYSAFDRELLAIYRAIKRFRYFVEGQQFHVLTDHKPLTTVFNNNKSTYTPRQLRHIEYVSQFTTDIRYVRGCDNAPADALSRNIHAVSSSLLDYAAVAADQVDDAELQQLKNNAALQMRKIQMPGTSVQLYADVSTSNVRPYLPERHRYPMFRQLHDLSHPGIRASQQLMTSRFVWTGINTDVRLWTRTCLKCQASKVTRHTHSSPGTFAPVSTRFEHVHIDLVGPLPFSRGYRYLLTCVDRFTRWPEAAPLADITTDSVARAFIETWVSRFGVPLSLTSDRGSQFESNVWSRMMSLLGISRFRTTSYHPQANGMVERFHRQLKASLAASSSSREKWADSLPLTLLGIRTALKEDLQHSSAELVYGTTLRLPGELLASQPALTPCSVQDFATSLKESLASLRPVQPRTSTAATFASQDLDSCTHVFLRVDSVKRPLQQPYQGPFKVLRRTRKTFRLDIRGASQTVSIDRVKPAYILRDVPHTPATSTQCTAAVSTQGPRKTISFLLPRN